MTVYDLCSLYIEGCDDVIIYSFEADENVFEGTFDEAMRSEFADYDVETFGIENGIICINI